MQLYLLTLGLAALALAAPAEEAKGKGGHRGHRGHRGHGGKGGKGGKGTGKGAICPSNTNPLCCFGSINGIITADCTGVPEGVNSIAAFKAACVAQGEQAFCCDANVGGTIGAFCAAP